jgi:hypothetical protein
MYPQTTISGLPERDGEMRGERPDAARGAGAHGQIHDHLQGAGRAAGGIHVQGPGHLASVPALGGAAPVRLDRAGVHDAGEPGAHGRAPRPRPGGLPVAPWRSGS